MAGKSQLDNNGKSLEEVAREVNAAAQTPLAAPKDIIRGLTKEELRELALETISEALQSVNATVDPEMAIKIANAALDRIDGKPGQAVTMVSTVNVNLVAQEMMDNGKREVREALRLLNAPAIDN